MDGFAGVSFQVSETGPVLRAEWPTVAAVDVQQTATGARTVYQVDGFEPAELSLTLRMTGAQYSALRGKVGTSGTLTVAPSTYGNVLLKSLTEVIRRTIADRVECTAVFLGVGA